MIWACIVALGHLTGFITSLRALMEVRTSQGAIAWVLMLNIFPYVSVPAFWIFGSSKFHGYVRRRRQDMLKTSPVAMRFGEQLVERGLLHGEDREKALLVERLAKQPFTNGNEVELLIDGKATFQSIFDGIDAAREYILVEFYIIHDDGLGRDLQQRLIAKAREGVRVYVLYDEIGSNGLSKAYQQELHAAGAAIHPFNTSQWRANRLQLNFRNHRKIVVVDGRYAWVGGHNVGDEYLGLNPIFGAWRDTHVKVTGPVVPGVQLAFFEDWHWATRHLLKLRWEAEPADTESRCTALCLSSGPADPLETCTLFFLHIINRATKRLWIASPYFVPDEQFISALQLAALRGVDVRILLPAKPDNLLVSLSAWSFVVDLTHAGVHIHKYTAGFMHQKVVLVDDSYATVGTANFDNRSFRLNFELTVVVVSEAFAGKIHQMLEADFARSKPITAQDFAKRGFWFRLLTRAARLLAPIQ
ncbi:MAG TPA: cardiolipin synthase [Candidatus Methylacidiphilales bacterium]|nr:cardiolipin synthase [Candidatus Methylacidiphilales bacterium]